MVTVTAALSRVLWLVSPAPQEREAVLVEVTPEHPASEPGAAPDDPEDPEAPLAPEASGEAATGASPTDGWDFDFGALGSGFGEDADIRGAAPPAGEAAKPGPDASDGPEKGKKKRRADVGKILGGSLRLTGAYLHFDDEPTVYPDGDDALGVGLGRITVDAKAGKHVAFAVNGFVELSRSPAGSLGGAFASAGSTESAYRTRYLGWTFWRDGAVRGSLGLDRLATSITAGRVKIDVGRFPINYTVNHLYTPNDFYAPFSATAVNRVYKPGVDALRVSVAAGPLASIDVVGVLGYEPDGVPSWGRASLLTRAGFVGGGFAWGILGGKVAERWVVGGSTQGDAGPIGLRAEFHVGFPDRDGRGRSSGDLPIYVRAAGGPSVSFAWRNASIGAEYMFISDGARKPGSYLTRVAGIYTDTVPFLARHYVSASVGLDLVPILKAATFGLVNANDGSGLTGLSLLYNVANESDLILGLFVPWGRGVRGLDPITMLPQLGSEYGLSPLVVYFESRVYF